jgi:hypothetical protein
MGCRIEDGCCAPKSKSKSDYHGWEECPDVDEPCGGDDSASCSGLSVQGTLESDEFCTECFNEFTPKVDFSFSADNFGYVAGEGQILCPNYGTDSCEICSLDDTLTPQVLAVPGKNGKYKKMKISYFGQNSPHGGPYGIFLYADFYFEDPNN